MPCRHLPVDHHASGAAGGDRQRPDLPLPAARADTLFGLDGLLPSPSSTTWRAAVIILFVVSYIYLGTIAPGSPACSR